MIRRVLSAPIIESAVLEGVLLVQLPGVATELNGGQSPGQNLGRMFSKVIYAGTVDVVGPSIQRFLSG